MSLIMFRAIRVFSLAASVATAPRLFAADQIRVQWNELCRTSQGHQLNIRTSAGETVEGACLAITVDEVSIQTRDHRVVKLTRAALARVEMQRAMDEGHQLRALGRGVHKSLKKSISLLFSQYAPAGIVAVPATLAWGAIAAPFCVLGDLAHHGGPEAKEIKII